VQEAIGDEVEAGGYAGTLQVMDVTFAGRAKPSMSLDVYSHLLPADEVAAGVFVEILNA
jgi:hypothetical protein